MRYVVTLTDGTSETVGPADSFQHEGPMTTFFASERHRGTLDCWSTKLASFRTERILKIVRREEGREAGRIGPCASPSPPTMPATT